MKRNLYVTQLSSEPGTDIAWSDWLVLAHDDDMGDPKANTWRRIDRLLETVDLDWSTFDEELDDPAADTGEKRFALWLNKIRPELEAKGFEIIGPAMYVFS